MSEIHGPFYHVTQNEKDLCEICQAQLSSPTAPGVTEEMVERRSVAARLLFHRQSQKGRCCDDCYCVALANAISEYSNPVAAIPRPASAGVEDAPRKFMVIEPVSET